MSRLLYLTAELFEEEKIDEQIKKLLKCKYLTTLHLLNEAQSHPDSIHGHPTKQMKCSKSNRVMPSPFSPCSENTE